MTDQTESQDLPPVEVPPAAKVEKPRARCAVVRCRETPVLSGLCETHWRSAAGAS